MSNITHGELFKHTHTHTHTHTYIYIYIYINIYAGHSKGSKPHPDFKFVIHLSLLYKTHQHRN